MGLKLPSFRPLNIIIFLYNYLLKKNDNFKNSSSSLDLKNYDDFYSSKNFKINEDKNLFYESKYNYDNYDENYDENYHEKTLDYYLKNNLNYYRKNYITTLDNDIYNVESHVIDIYDDESYIIDFKNNSYEYLKYYNNNCSFYNIYNNDSGYGFYVYIDL